MSLEKRKVSFFSEVDSQFRIDDVSPAHPAEPSLPQPEHEENNNPKSRKVDAKWQEEEKMAERFRAHTNGAVELAEKASGPMVNAAPSVAIAATCVAKA